MIKKLSIVILILLSSFFLFSQNIFDAENSEKYAKHLFNTKDYNSAILEYERLILLCPDSSKYKKQLILSLKLSGLETQLSEKINNYYGTSFCNYSPEIINIYLQSLILEGEYKKCDTILNSKIHLTKENKDVYKFAILLLTNKNIKAKHFIEENFKIKTGKKASLLIEVFNENRKRKKPILASVLSAIIPGMGKFYANDVKNAFGIFSIVALNSWQSYRGFSNEGVKSFYGWAFGTLAAGFYIANIYGANKSAERENNFQKINFNEKITNIICDF